MTPKWLSPGTTPKWLERQIDEALLLVATQAAFLYAQRRGRRMLPKMALGAAVLAGVGVAAATVAAGLGAVGLAGGAAAWYRYKNRSRDTFSPASDTWGVSAVATPAGPGGAKAADPSGKDT
jgi:4-amino-4-deoxy-L-arabinose transferase-like glycosyltransferase